MRTVFIVFLVLAGCETAPRPPSPAAQRLQEHCDAGDTDACGMLLGAQQQQADARAAIAMAYLANRRPAYTPPQTVVVQDYRLPPPMPAVTHPIPLSVMP
jgi:hypothetical protein